jgi:hypothetical protein
MKRIVMFALVAAVAVAFTGCKKKEPTLTERMSGAAEQVKKEAVDAAKVAEKAGDDAKNSVDKAMEK